MRLLCDLGGDASLALTQAALDELGIRATGAGHRIMDFKGSTFEARGFRVARLRIGNAAFTNVSGSLQPHASYIGLALFAANRIVLDYRGGKMTLIARETEHLERAACGGAPCHFRRALPRRRPISAI